MRNGCPSKLEDSDLATVRVAGICQGVPDKGRLTGGTPGSVPGLTGSPTAMTSKEWAIGAEDHLPPRVTGNAFQ
jgi:hypothetical protein